MILAAISVLGVLGFVFGAILAYSSKKFAVHVDPKVRGLKEILPGLNCGACGYAGCEVYAEVVIKNGIDINKCTVGGKDTIKEIAAFLGVEMQEHQQKVALVHCMGKRDNCKTKYVYKGIKDCRALTLVSGGDKYCTYSCLGQGDCVTVCPVNAIKLEGEVAIIEKEKCVGCGLCIKICPRDLIELVPYEKFNHVLCSSNDKAAIAKKNCSVSCIGCAICKKNCPVDAITIEKFLARIDYSKCIDCGVCATKCPTKAIKDFKHTQDKKEPSKSQEELL